MVSERELRRSASSDNQRHSDSRFSVPPPGLRRARGFRVSRSVDRDAATATDYSPTRVRPEYTTSALTRPVFRRRFSLSAVTAASAAGTDDDSHLRHADAEFYGSRPPKSASQVRWSRKDVVYTAENMGFSHMEHGPRHTLSARYVSSPSRRDANISQPRSRSRSGSVTRFVDGASHMDTQAAGRRRRGIVRASSVPRMDSTTSPMRPARHTAAVGRRPANIVRSYSATVGRSSWPASYSAMNYGPTSVIRTTDSDGIDIASFVLAPGEQFIPTDVSVSVLPSGKRAVTYTRFSQRGTGNQQEANVQLDRIIQRTNRLQVVCVKFHY